MRRSLLLSLISLLTSLPSFSSQPQVGTPPPNPAWPEEELVRLVSSPDTLPPLPSRPPFTLHDYDLHRSGHKWTVPLDEEASLLRHISEAYESAREVHAHRGVELVTAQVPDVDELSMGDDVDLLTGEPARRPQRQEPKFKYVTVEKLVLGLLPVSGLLDMVRLVVNPDVEDLDYVEEQRIEAAVEALKVAESLLDERAGVYLGFLNKGAPLRLLRSLFVELREGRRNRGPVGRGDKGRRQLKTPDARHTDGLWEHEIAVDYVPDVPVGWARQTLQM